MKNLLKIITTLFLALTIAFSFEISGVVAATNDSEANTAVSYQYPIKGGTVEWKKFNSHKEMLDAVQIPETRLKAMSTAELVESVLNYPLYGDMYAYDTFQQGIDSLTLQFNGLSELLKRVDAGAVMIAKYKEKDPLKVTKLTTDVEKGNFSMNLGFLESILSQNKIISGLSNEQKKDLLEVAKQKKQQKLVRQDVFGLTLSTSKILVDKLETASKFSISSFYTYVYTPRGTAVQVYVDDRVKTYIEQQWDANWVNTYYPQATILAPSSFNYNCHSYAWYWTSTSNGYWMDDPSAYMTDGSSVYIGTNPGIFIAGLKMYYPGLHSGILTDRSPSNSNDYSNMTEKSKWGQMPLMSHKANYCPYDSSTIKFYN